MSDMIQNPLVAGQQINTDNVQQIMKEYYNVYFIVTKNNYEVNNAIYDLMIDKSLYYDIVKNFILVSAPIYIIKIPKHFNRVTIVNDTILKDFNIFNYNLREKNLVIMTLNISYDNIKLYLQQFDKKYTFVSFYKTLSMNTYFDSKISFDNLEKNINNLYESNYWVNNSKCKVGITSYFEQRQFNFYVLKNITKDLGNYLDEIYKCKNYIDPSKIILTNTNQYKINNYNVFSKSDIYNLLSSLPAKQQYLLFCNLLISKTYCHLVLNNIKVLQLMKTVIYKYAQLFRYLIGYAWIRFYFDESIKKTFTRKEDQFIFDIDTASELPIYPFSIKYPKLNPYMPILVKDTVLNSEYNFGGISDNKTKENVRKIANFEEFKANLNIFCTGDPTYNLFENIRWTEDKIALSGSTVCACIQKYNPLMEQFNNYSGGTEKQKRYYNEYYAKSDIDVMFLTNNQIDFMNKVKTFHNQLSINICSRNNYAQPEHIKLKCEKQVFLFVSEQDINNIIEKNKLSLTFDYIKSTFELQETKELFKDIFDEQLTKFKKIFFSKITPDKLDEYTFQYPDYINFDDLTYKVRLHKTKNEINYDINISINFKYRIISPHLDYPLELFMVNYDDFFATVQTFHLPCVRAYYDGDNVYMTPSCVSSHLTYMNIDYKYFAGTNDPIDIINKYRMRGFGIWLNENEKTLFLKYSEANLTWNNLYNISFKNEKSVETNLGCLQLNHKLFKPRLYNIEEYYDVIPVDLQMGYSDIKDNSKIIIITMEDYFNEIKTRFNSIDLILTNKLQTINSEGTINPIQKWVIEASWNIGEQLLLSPIPANDQKKINIAKYKLSLKNKFTNNTNNTNNPNNLNIDLVSEEDDIIEPQFIPNIISSQIGATGATGTTISGQIGATGATGTTISGQIGATGATGTTISGQIGATGNTISGQIGVTGETGNTIFEQMGTTISEQIDLDWIDDEFMSDEEV